MLKILVFLVMLSSGCATGNGNDNVSPLLRSEAFEDDLRIFENYYDVLMAMPVVEGDSILVVNPGDSLWQGMLPGIKRDLLEMLRIADKLKLLPDSILPIRIMVVDDFKIARALSRSPSAIVFDSDMMTYRTTDVVIHEFAHLVIPDTENRGHSKRWRKTCNRFLLLMTGNVELPCKESI